MREKLHEVQRKIGKTIESFVIFGLPAQKARNSTHYKIICLLAFVVFRAPLTANEVRKH